MRKCGREAAHALDNGAVIPTRKLGPTQLARAPRASHAKDRITDLTQEEIVLTADEVSDCLAGEVIPLSANWVAWSFLGLNRSADWDADR